MITWLSTKSPLRILEPQIDQAMEQYLRENSGVDSGLLAIDLKLSARRVESHQRRLGLRKCVPSGRRALG